MRFALLKDERIEATKGAKGVCPCCGNDLVAKCGEVYIHHWAHKKKCDDYWWENETEWHRNWKNKFPSEWQEIIHKDESGEKHIADVKTSSGWTIEFQHSSIARKERDSRDYFYNKLIWVVDGTRRKTDIKQFQHLINEAIFIADEPTVSKVNYPEDSRLIREWGSSKSLVLMDFSIDELWLIYPSNNDIYVSSFLRNSFIELLNNTKSDEVDRVLINPVQKGIEKSEVREKARESREKARESREKARESREKARRKIAAEKAIKKFLKAMGRKPVDKQIAYVIGICRNRFNDFDIKVASTVLNGYVKALKFGYSDEKIVDEFERKVIPKTKEVTSWTEWKNIMERFKQEIGEGK